MKLLCDREQLLAAFGAVGGVVPARSPKPILQNLKLVAAPGQGSTLMATDLEVGIRYKVLGVKVDQPGSVILPVQRMGQILRTSTGDDELALEVDGEALVVRGQPYRQHQRRARAMAIRSRRLLGLRQHAIRPPGQLPQAASGWPVTRGNPAHRSGGFRAMGLGRPELHR